MIDDQSPLRRMCQDDDVKYRDSARVVGDRLDAGAGRRIWAQPVAPGLVAALIRWVEIDVLEERKTLTVDQVCVLRAETLAAYAETEKDPAGARWAETFARAVSAAAAADCRQRASAVLARMQRRA
jgi:hypothetical protein